jgi:hypothetical protein
MTGSKDIVEDIKPNTSNITVSYGDKSSSKVLGFGKVVITPDVSLVNVMLVETIYYIIKTTNNGWWRLNIANQWIGSARRPYTNRTRKKEERHTYARKRTRNIHVQHRQA